MHNAITFLRRIISVTNLIETRRSVTENVHEYVNIHVYYSRAIITNVFDFMTLLYFVPLLFFVKYVNSIRCARENTYRRIYIQKWRAKIQRGGYECTEFQSSQFILAHLQWHEVKHKRRLYEGGKR